MSVGARLGAGLWDGQKDCFLHECAGAPIGSSVASWQRTDSGGEVRGMRVKFKPRLLRARASSAEWLPPSSLLGGRSTVLCPLNPCPPNSTRHSRRPPRFFLFFLYSLGPHTHLSSRHALYIVSHARLYPKCYTSSRTKSTCSPPTSASKALLANKTNISCHTPFAHTITGAHTLCRPLRIKHRLSYFNYRTGLTTRTRPSPILRAHIYLQCLQNTLVASPL